MSNPVLTSAILIEANGAALNNAGNDAGQRLDNAVVVKQIRVGKNNYPYISGQAVRRWWREVLYSDFAWQPSPVTREAKSAYTAGDPISYPDDDVFGYMAAKKATKPPKKSKTGVSVPAPNEDDTAEPTESGESGGTQKRVSPLKNSLLVSILPNTITTDFGHFSRGLPVDNPNLVPFEHEHYTALMQGVFTISLQDIGRFECGKMRDIAEDTPVTEASEVVHEAQGNLHPRLLGVKLTERRKRVKETLLALGRLRHGANLTRNLSDVAPVIVLLGYIDGGNAPFQNLFTADTSGQVILNLPRFISVLKDYNDRLIAGTKLYFGYRPGILANESELLTAFQAGIEGVQFFIGTPGEAIKEAAAQVDTVVS